MSFWVQLPHPHWLYYSYPKPSIHSHSILLLKSKQHKLHGTYHIALLQANTCQNLKHWIAPNNPESWEPVLRSSGVSSGQWRQASSLTAPSATTPSLACSHHSYCSVSFDFLQSYYSSSTASFASLLKAFDAYPRHTKPQISHWGKLEKHKIFNPSQKNLHSVKPHEYLIKKQIPQFFFSWFVQYFGDESFLIIITACIYIVFDSFENTFKYIYLFDPK